MRAALRLGDSKGSVASLVDRDMDRHEFCRAEISAQVFEGCSFGSPDFCPSSGIGRIVDDADFSRIVLSVAPDCTVALAFRLDDEGASYFWPFLHGDTSCVVNERWC